ncbi:hypothetical protein LNAOJCKE_0390 [Methylorubrum aminovorans]|uniref:Uncharacterized protein n=1 Tax=Methylorubrum aminovorans TaxID=269069 RepID=A0ABQ4U7H3_9HYPH|nr:hypothetical protein [Methylorubrum aminovorans]GJE63196.1 hypothetical protein LNAOJCKE_0390 [Methylorubrum aminovorans]GMA79238.1 hypothetical protein GCM10025880_56550 [Methylorubrum aminovorans]
MFKLNFVRFPNPIYPEAVQWMAMHGHHSFSIIREDDGTYTATSKDRLQMRVPCKYIPTDDHAFDTFDDAIDACNLEALRLSRQGKH